MLEDLRFVYLILIFLRQKCKYEQLPDVIGNHVCLEISFELIITATVT